MRCNNNFNIDYVCPGFCSLCFCEVAEFNGSFEVAPGIFRPRIKVVIEDGKPQPVLKGNYRTRLVDLSDGSQMSVTLCEECSELKPKDLPTLMKNEANGWQKEIEHFQANIEHKKNLSIIDVPDMRYNEETKLKLKESKNAIGK